MPQEDKRPKSWKNAARISSYKMEELTNLKKYQPLSLLSVVVYSQFTVTILQFVLKSSHKQNADFWSGFLTMDNIQIINKLKEKTKEYRKSLAFTDSRKGFDSVQTVAVVTAIRRQGAEET